MKDKNDMSEHNREQFGEHSEQFAGQNRDRTGKPEKTQVEDIDRSIYDIRNDGADDYRFDAGLSAEIVERLSEEKNDPAWMR